MGTEEVKVKNRNQAPLRTQQLVRVDGSIQVRVDSGLN